MPLNKRTTRVFYKWLYRTEMITITLLKRNDDQQQGTVAAYKLFNCRFSDLHKKGQAILGEMSSVFYSRLYIPDRELARVNIQYLNVLDRIIDTKNRTWQPESGELIDDKTFENMWGIDVLMLDGRSQS